MDFSPGSERRFRSAYGYVRIKGGGRGGQRER